MEWQPTGEIGQFLLVGERLRTAGGGTILLKNSLTPSRNSRTEKK